MSKKKVCIIGAGIAGLISCKILAEDHYDVTLYEKSSEYGGVWSKNRAYANLWTNIPLDVYCFSDMPPLKGKEGYVTAASVREYYSAYVKKHDLLKYMVFNAEVIRAEEVAPDNDEKWKVTARVEGNEITKIFDFLVVATGLFEKPFIPTIPNAFSFRGRILHACQVKDVSDVENKRVLIVGSGKSAADMATLAAEHSSRCKMILRISHWLFPRFLFGKLNARYLLYPRLIRYLVSYHKLSFVDWLIQKLLYVPRTILFKVAEACILRQMNFPENSALIPNCPILQDVGIGIEPLGFYEAVRNGKIESEKTTILRFVPGSKQVDLANGKTEEFDVVIFATGYDIRFPFFDAKTLQKLQLPYGGSVREIEQPFRLYKGVVPIKGPKTIGFVGFQSTGGNSVMDEIQANWLSEYFLGSISLPPEQVQEREVALYLAWEKTALPYIGGIGCQVLFSYFHMIDELLADIKVSATRTNNFFSEYIQPIYPSRYQIRSERIRNRALSRPPSQFFFSFTLFIVLLAVFAYLLFKL